MRKNKSTTATKDDIEKLRGELKNFATKKDLENFATKKDLKKYATKQDLNKMISVIAVKIVEINNNTKKELKNDIYNFQDKILREIVKLREDNEVVRGHRQILEDHEERISKLENCNA